MRHFVYAITMVVGAIAATIPSVSSSGSSSAWETSSPGESSSDAWSTIWSSALPSASPASLVDDEPNDRPSMRLSPGPGFPTDPGVTPHCSWWLNLEGTALEPTCDEVPGFYWITREDFVRWNPVLRDSCNAYVPGKSFCVEVTDEPPTVSTTIPVTTTTPPTSPGNGIATPTPTQPDIVSNCNKFHLIVSGDRCSTVSTKYGIPVANFLEWNPKALSSCTGLKQNAYACVSVIGFTPTPTNPGNGITTPSPTQPDIVSNCNKFHLIVSGDRCSTVSTKYGIPVANFLEWNPKALSSCTGLKQNAYACVSVIGFTPTPTNPGNGITTPLPTQPDIVTNCDKFEFVRSGEFCSTVATRSGISITDFLKWNPAAGSSCTGLWANAYACVSVIGHTPTTPGNGITTPVPTQPDIVTNCNRFHLVQSGERCSTVSTKYNLPVNLFLEWNPKALSNCSGLKLNSYACVNIIGYTPTTPTSPGNGVTTPSPVQDGMTKNCKTFHFVTDGQTCAAIQTKYKVTLANLYRWNPAIGSDCRSMWAKTYVCIAVL